MIELYSPRSESELLVLRSVFDQARIPYFVKNDAFGSLTVGPQIELYNRKTICVGAGEVEEAVALLRDFFERTGAADEEQRESRSYSRLDKLRMVLEVLLFGWFLPGRRRRPRSPDLRLIKGAGAATSPPKRLDPP